MDEAEITITMDQIGKNKFSIPRQKKNSETFDLWGKAQFAMWSNIRYDFELVAELTRHKIKNTRFCLDLLQTVNEHLKNSPEKVFFDGTIKCLKYLIKNQYLDLSDLPKLTQDEKYLVELLEKYSKRLDITEVLSDIEEPTLRVMLLEYPHLLSEILKDAYPLSGYLIGNAMRKNGITGLDDFLKKVDNGLNAIEVDQDKNSTEAMKCKLIYLGLLMLNKQLSITRDMGEEFMKLTNDVIESGSYTKGIFNATYVTFYGHSFWNEEKKGHLSGCDTLYLDFELLSLPANHMSMIYEIFLKEETEKVGKKYFGNNYQYEGCVASLAIKMAIVIILFRTENSIPLGEKQCVSIFSAGTMINALDYAVEETKDDKKPLKLKKWFLDYFSSELDKRVAFIKLQIENGIGLYQMGEIVRAVYIPVFESFNFFCSRKGLLEQVIDLLKNKNISNKIKDDIFINFVINIQKINADTRTLNEEKYFKDTFILLITQTFEGLMTKLAQQLQYQSQKYYENGDLFADATLGVLELILGFDLSKNDSFIGYLTFNLPLKIKTSSRTKKIDDLTDTESILGNSFNEDEMKESFLSSIPDVIDFVSSLDDEKNLQKMQECIEKLSGKEREALRKLAENNAKLNDTERKAKNRGLNRVREMMEVS